MRIPRDTGRRPGRLSTGGQVLQVYELVNLAIWAIVFVAAGIILDRPGSTRRGAESVESDQHFALSLSKSLVFWRKTITAEACPEPSRRDAEAAEVYYFLFFILSILLSCQVLPWRSLRLCGYLLRVLLPLTPYPPSLFALHLLSALGVLAVPSSLFTPLT